MNYKNYRNTLLIALMCIIPALTYSQVQIGVKGGLNLSNLYIDTDEIDDENSRLGYHAGGILKLNVTDYFAIQPEVLYSTKGTKAEYNFGDLLGEDVTAEYDFNMNYVDVPILAVVTISDILELHAGPYFGFLTNAEATTDADLGGFGDFEENSDLDDDNFQQIDYGASVGAAVNFGGAQVGARYNLGLTDIQDSEMAEQLLGDSKHSYAQVYVSFMLIGQDE